MRYASYWLMLWLLLFSLPSALTAFPNRTVPGLREQEDPPANDAAIIAVQGIDGSFCGPEASLTLVLSNEGTDTLFSAIILYGVAFPFSQLNWEGVLPPGATEGLDVLVSPLLPGNNQFAAASGLPNGVIDERPANDGLEVSFQAQPDGQEVRVQLKTDAQPGATQWVLTNAAGDTLSQAGPFAQANSLQEATLCLPNGCYTFFLNDSTGDGLAAPPNGSLRLLNEEDTILAQLLPEEANFGSQASFDFCLPFECALGASAETTVVSDTNTADGSLLLLANNGIPPLSYSIDDGANFQENPLFTGLGGGNYTCRIRDQNQCETTLEVQVPVCALELNAVVTDVTGEENNGAIHLSASGNFGPVVYQLNGGVFQDSSSFNGLAAGSYTIAAMDSLGCGSQLTATVDLIFSNSNSLPGASIQLFPNPAGDWVYLSVKHFAVSRAIPVELVNLQGKVFQIGRLLPKNNGVNGRISLKSLPAGIYFLRLRHRKLLTELPALIKR